jgi:hypothetical protein
MQVGGGAQEDEVLPDAVAPTWSLDQVAWQSMTSGQARVTIPGLTPAKLDWFRARAFLRDGTTTDPWASSIWS